MTKQELEKAILALPLEELARHAHISLDNNHYCSSCFCCACLDELRNRQRLWGDKDPYEGLE